MTAQQVTIDTIANNLANVNTVGFKASRVDFQDLVYQTIREPGGAATESTQFPTGVQIGLGARYAAIQRLFSPGDLRQTGNSFDLAIEGDGFFQILLPDGRTAYTRDGAFKLDGQGRVVNSDGHPLQPEIAIPADAMQLTVGSDGTVSVSVAGQTDPQQLGQITLAKFLNPAGLSSLGRNLLIPTAASGEAVIATPGTEGIGGLAQGILEMSNVNIIEEMVSMIVAQRAYEVNSKSIQVADEMLAMANSLHR
jgi:flagellar basal-body rod protein FlgG